MGEERGSQTIVNWFIGLGVLGAAWMFWMAAGFPGLGDIGQELNDGEYSCFTAGGPGLGSMGGPGVTVRNGEVVEAHHYDLATLTERPAPFSNVEIVSRTELTLTSTYPLGNDIAGEFVCEKS